MHALVQQTFQDRPPARTLATMIGLVRQFADVVVLGVEAERRAVAARRARGGDPAGEVVADVDVGGLARGRRGERRHHWVERRLGAHRQSHRGAEPRRPQRDALPQPDRPPRLRAERHAIAAPVPIGEHGVGAFGPGQEAPVHDAHHRAALDQRVGFLHQPRVGRWMTRCDQAYPQPRQKIACRHHGRPLQTCMRRARRQPSNEAMTRNLQPPSGARRRRVRIRLRSSAASARSRAYG